jgi:hypothetical protein
VPASLSLPAGSSGEEFVDVTLPGRSASIAAYRERVPSIPASAVATHSVGFSFERGRCVFIALDTRADREFEYGPVVTMIGTRQKNWLKSILSDPANAEKLFVMLSPTPFHSAVGRAGTWVRLATERTEIVDYVKTHCPGRFVVFSADDHFQAYDDGTHTDFATGGGEPVPYFESGPLDQVIGFDPRPDDYTEGPLTCGATASSYRRIHQSEAATRVLGWYLTSEWIDGSSLDSIRTRVHQCILAFEPLAGRMTAELSQRLHAYYGG